jgi:hypothetical protein
MQWVGSGYNNYYYFNVADGATWGINGTAAGWYDGIAGNPAPVNLTNGAACFIYNPASKGMTNTYTGTVFQGTRYTTIYGGYNLIALQVPISTNALVAGYGLPPLNSDPNGPTGASGNGDGTNDIYMQWAGTGYNNYYYFNVADGATWGINGTAAGFYDGISGDPMPASSSPAVNQGFFLYHFGYSWLSWTNSFTVQ